MKIALVAAVCLVLVAVVAAENAKQRPTRRPIKRCNDGDDCADDECCVGVLFLKGTCRQRLGEGKRCIDDEGGIRGKYLLQCPCAQGLKCIPEKVEEHIFGQVRINERCRTGASPSPEPEVTTGGQVSRETVEEQSSAEPEVELSTAIPEEE
ncbi:uncharacterized protein [Parasteatoda tepidariorum]|uniref:uncharacterized protein n=1 Tax=Parasteatoda tepidariorum TaxID=114398 RepID=UPI0039BD17F4